MALSKNQILATNDIKKETVSVPEWGGEVIVKALSGSERDEYESSLFDGNKSKASMANVRAKLCALSMVDDSGERMFTLKEAKELGNKSAAALDRVFKVAQDLSGLGAGAIEEAAENLDDGQG